MFGRQKKEADEARTKLAQSLDRAIHSEHHKRLTERLNAQYHARVEEWMETAVMTAEVPPLYPKPMSKADIDAQPYKFYRNTAALSSRGGGGKKGRRSSTGGLDPAAPPPLPDHMQMSPLRFQTEKDRLAAYLASETHASLTGQAPYSDPHIYPYRARHKNREISAKPFVYKPQSERLRIQEAITARDVGGRAFPYEEPKLYPQFRTEDKGKWKAGQFTARLPSLPVFSREERMLEPYVSPSAAQDVFRPEHPSTARSGSAPHGGASTARFSSQVPSDRLLTLPDSSPRCPHPPVSDFRGTCTLSAGLTSSGIHGSAFSLDLSKAHDSSSHSDAPPEQAQPAKTYWKALTTLAHQPPPPPGGSYSARAQRDADTAQQLFKTYRKHLAY